MTSAQGVDPRPTAPPPPRPQSHRGRDFAAERRRVILKARAALATMRVAEDRAWRKVFPSVFGGE